MTVTVNSLRSLRFSSSAYDTESTHGPLLKCIANDTVITAPVRRKNGNQVFKNAQQLQNKNNS